MIMLSRRFALAQEATYLALRMLFMRGERRARGTDSKGCRPGKITDAADFCPPEFSEHGRARWSE